MNSLNYSCMVKRKKLDDGIAIKKPVPAQGREINFPAVPPWFLPDGKRLVWHGLFATMPASWITVDETGCA
jgi:hypothetical protein